MLNSFLRSANIIDFAHIVLATIQFFLVNWVGKHSTHAGYHQISFVQSVEDAPLFNAVYRIIAPQIFLVTSAAVLYLLRADHLVVSFWRVTVWYFGIRWLFIIAMNRAGLVNWFRQSAFASIAIVISFFLSSKLLTSRDQLLPSAASLRDQLWIIVVGFLYVTANNVEWPTIGATPDERKKKYVLRRYSAERDRFHRVIRNSSSELAVEVLAFAVLLYESFNRPAIVQKIERYVLFPRGMASSLGPMQVQTPVQLEDSMLVKLGVERLDNAFCSSVGVVWKEAAWLERGESEGDSTSPRSFSALPRFLQRTVLFEAAKTYNVRSDYPEQVLGIAIQLIEGPYSEEWSQRYPDPDGTDDEARG